MMFVGSFQLGTFYDSTALQQPPLSQVQQDTSHRASAATTAPAQTKPLQICAHRAARGVLSFHF